MPFFYRPRVLRHARRPLSSQSERLLSRVDQLLGQAAPVAAVSIETAEKTLNSIPYAERGVDFTERWVQIYAAQGKKGVRAAALAAQIRAHHIAQGDRAALARFEGRLQNVLGERDLTAHGYGSSFQRLDRPALAKDLSRLFKELKKLEYPVFINSGTLLGSIRDQDFIGHDDDVDLAVVLPATSARDALTSLMAYRLALLSADVGSVTPFFSGKSPVLKIARSSGLQVDVFPAWIANDRVFVWPHTFGELTASDVLPLRKSEICGESFPVPAEPEKMLVLNYGADWKVPDSNFVFQWSDARRRFSSLLRRYRALQKIDRLKSVFLWSKGKQE